MAKHHWCVRKGDRRLAVPFKCASFVGDGGALLESGVLLDQQAQVTDPADETLPSKLMVRTPAIVSGKKPGEDQWEEFKLELGDMVVFNPALASRKTEVMHQAEFSRYFRMLSLDEVKILNVTEFSDQVELFARLMEYQLKRRTYESHHGRLVQGIHDDCYSTDEMKREMLASSAEILRAPDAGRMIHHAIELANFAAALWAKEHKS